MLSSSSIHVQDYFQIPVTGHLPFSLRLLPLLKFRHEPPDHISQNKVARSRLDGFATWE
jgi:hypothetical protein